MNSPIETGRRELNDCDDLEERNYRVILEGIGQNTEEEKTQFSRHFSEKHQFPFEQIKSIADRCPIVIKKDLPFKKAERLAKALELCGAMVSIEKRQSLCPILLEPLSNGPISLGLESANNRRTAEGVWEVIGKVRNQTEQDLFEIWVLIQALDEYNELLAYEEIPLPFNPVPPNVSSPFKVLFEKDLPVKKFLIAFKTASGTPLPTRDHRVKKEWVGVRTQESKPSTIVPQRPEGFEEAFDWGEEEKDIVLSELREETETEGREGPTRDHSPFEFNELEGLEPPSPMLREGGQEQEEGATEKVEKRFQHGEEPLPFDALKEEEELHLDITEGEETPESSSMATRFDFHDKTEEGAFQRSSDGEKTPAYPWLPVFRHLIEETESLSEDPFLTWFQTWLKDESVENPNLPLLIILTYARFNQTHSSATALENTKKVFPSTVKGEVSSEEIPPLQGDLFFPPEVWRELYIRALPRLKEVANQIAERYGWRTSDLDRLIRIIPHMTAMNSRWAIRVIHQWMPEIVPDISDLEVDIQEGLYRVASRLGVINPLFDFYQGRGSMGDQKIQAFAKLAFPEDPLKIESPLNRIGSPEGFCLPTQPLCLPCPLTPICPKLFTDFDPSERGMLGSFKENAGGLEWKNRR